MSTKVVIMKNNNFFQNKRWVALLGNEGLWCLGLRFPAVLFLWFLPLSLPAQTDRDRI